VVAAGGGAARGGGVALAPARVGIVSRLVGFLQGSWRELQRVQWPDRRQVAQATGVVLGFVIVAGVFLGLSDLVAQKLINFIING
jgi:preprotein translocase subunit SecE